jgi:hypothetical protein
MPKLAKSYRALQAQAKYQSHQIGYLLLMPSIHSILMQCKLIGMLVRLAAWMPSGDVRCSLTDQGGATFRLRLRQRSGFRLMRPDLGLGLRWVAGLAAI